MKVKVKILLLCVFYITNNLKAQNCVKSTNFENMKNIEQNSGFIESVLSKNDSKKIPFFHLGPKNDWREILESKYSEEISKKYEFEMKELGYL